MEDVGNGPDVTHTALRERVTEAMAWAAPRSRIGPAVRGPLITVALVIGLDLLARNGLRVIHPFPFLLLTVVYAAGTAGARSGLVSALVGVVYAVHFLARPGAILRYDPPEAYSLFALGVLMPVTAVLVARFRNAGLAARRAELTQDEIVALERRLSFFAEAYRLLASSLDYHRTLRDLARISVPTCADWCAIHLVNDQGAPQFVAGAHADPTRDLLVRALCEYDPKRLPFGQSVSWSGILMITDTMLEPLATADDARKLYRALAPRAVIQTPMYARDRVVGVITFGLSRGSTRSYQLDDLRGAEELANRAALAVDNARLYRDVEGAEDRTRRLFESNPQPMWIFDVETLEFLAVNEAALRHYGYTREEMLAMTVIDLRPPEDAPGLLSDLDHPSSGMRREEVALAQHQRKDGSVVEMELASSEFELDGRRVRLVLATDVTERARAHAALRRGEELLRQVQWMDAVGRLASGVAHDFNNLLTTIRGFSDMLLRDLPTDGEQYRDVVQIKTAADRGAQLTRQLLAFGRQQSPEPRRLDLNQVVGAVEALIHRLIGVDIRLVTQLQADAGQVHMDPSQLEQVLVNLILNAREAMPSGGTLTIATYQRQVTRAGRVRNLRPGDYVVLAVSDTGGGVDGESLQHVFKPFSGIKPQGQGGLGMAIIYGIVRQAGGAIRVASEPGRGTTIKVYLPRLVSTERPEPTAVSALHGTETVLVAEDEDGVRELLRRVLSDHGYTVLAARHGRDALLIAERYQRRIDLLVTDIVMPELDGAELAAQLRARISGLKVLYVSGYTNDEVVRRGVRYSSMAFMQKPFTAEEFMAKVRDILDAGEDTAAEIEASGS